MIRLFLGLALVWSFAACGGEATTEATDNQENAEANAETEGEEHGEDHSEHSGDAAEKAGDGIHYGAKIDPQEAQTLDMALAILNKEEGLEEVETADEKTAMGVKTKVSAKVAEVCAMNGCWMELQTEGGETVRVQFKDYGFFVPRSMAGKEVVVAGQLYKQETSVADLQHFAKDAGKSEEEIAQITEPKVGYKLYADGVVLVQ